VKKKYFGTDGMRGTVGQEPITPEFFTHLGWAIGKTIGTGKQVVIGQDTRESAEILIVALLEGLSEAGIYSELLGVIPTPGVAYLTKKAQKDLGIVISASHNPFTDNGIKLFSAQGFKVSDDVELTVENYLEQGYPKTTTKNRGKVQNHQKSAQTYSDFCQSVLGNLELLKGLKIVVDCAHGATYEIAPALFQELGATVECIGTDPNGTNINESCGSTMPAQLQKRVLETDADVGVAFDGDGDRLVMVDNCGEIVDGDELLFIIVQHALCKKSIKGGVVGTVMSNLGLELALKNLRLPFVRTQVGDRFIVDELLARNWQLGGENSGHLLHLGYSTTGDGMLSALLVLWALQDNSESLHELKKGMKKYPQILVNVKTDNGAEILTNPTIKEAIKAAEQQLQDSGRVLLRTSGTEPLLRIMVEGEDLTQITTLAQQLAVVVEECNM